jgi:hypothetical protein
MDAYIEKYKRHNRNGSKTDVKQLKIENDVDKHNEKYITGMYLENKGYWA